MGADGTREKDGQKLSLRFTLPQRVPTTENEAGLLQSQLAEVGITLTLGGVDSDKFQTEYVRRSNFEITGFTWVGTQYPMGNLGQVYSSTGGSNYSKISVPEIDSLVTQANTAQTNEERLKLTTQIDVLVWENVFNISIYNRVQLTAVPKKLANFGAVDLGSFRPEDVGYLSE